MISSTETLEKSKIQMAIGGIVMSPSAMF